jgi:DNA repair protein RecN (Recombination protein N)
MLQSLFIDNYALIEHLEIHFNAGLSVITGETGAGKSIIMGALSLILGGRADAKAVRTGATKCVIEASFDITNFELQNFFRVNDLEYDAAATIIRREVYASGKSRAFINDVPVQLTMLKVLGESLIDIHSQHQNLMLGKDTFQQEVIDTLANDAYELGQYKTLYKELTMEQRRLKQLRDEATRNANEADYMRYQYLQLQDAELREGEQEELEQEQELLSHAEEIKNSLNTVVEVLNGAQRSVVSDLKQALHTAEGVSGLYPELEELVQRMESDYIDLKDIADEVEGHADRVNFDPQRSEVVGERLDLLYSLQKKHAKRSCEELIAYRDELGERLRHIENSDDEIAAIEQTIRTLTANVKKSAAALTQARRKAAVDFQAALIQKVSTLGMPNVRFEVRIEPTEDFTATGADRIGFLFSANKNQPLKAVGEIASGGEISRLMLSVKALISSAKTLPTIIFDEIDTGVSGDIADRMGEIMKQMSADLQVVTITHLPQVAGKGDTHYKVFKEDSETETHTKILCLSEEERVSELARMLSGSSLTPQAIENARVLLRSSHES